MRSLCTCAGYLLPTMRAHTRSSKEHGLVLTLQGHFVFRKRSVLASEVRYLSLSSERGDDQTAQLQARLSVVDLCILLRHQLVQAGSVRLKGFQFTFQAAQISSGLQGHDLTLGQVQVPLRGLQSKLQLASAVCPLLGRPPSLLPLVILCFSLCFRLLLLPTGPPAGLVLPPTRLVLPPTRVGLPGRLMP